MPTIVHTMLVRVDSTVCCGKVGSADDGAVTSGWGGAEASVEAALARQRRAARRSWRFLAPFR